MNILEINGKNVNTFEINRGASQTIVMVHGMLTNMSVFYFKMVPELAKYFHIVLYDFKSHGLSERCETGYDLVSLSDDLIGLLDILNIPKANIVGYSYGGLIALKTAMLHPERVEKVVIIDTPDPLTATSPETLQKFGDEFIEKYLNNYTETTLLRPGKRQKKKIKELYDYLFGHTTIREDFESDLNFFDDLVKHPIKAKIMFLYGLQSDCSMIGDLLHERIPNSVLYKGEGDHNIPIQNPHWLNNRLIEFIKE